MPLVSAANPNDPRSSPSTSDLLATIAPLLPLALKLFDDDSFAKLKQDVRDFAADDPIDAILATVIGGGLAFYIAERDTNPACTSPWDGVLYAATCLSVGYDNLFPTTTSGHAIATAIQTFGPALAAKSLDEPASMRRAAEAEARALDRAILERLDDIVRLLDAQQR